MDEEAIFKALADENRRTLLDVLFQRDGQTLSELSEHLDMTRFGVSKHLQILEDAGLLSTRKVGRSKHHYLNPVPIQLVYERWVSKYAKPWSQAIIGLKNALEETTMAAAPAHVFRTFIRTTPEKLWQALTDGAITKLYYFGTSVESTWERGAEYTYRYDTGEPMIQGEVLECTPPVRLVTTFKPMWPDNAESIPASRVTFEIEPQGELCMLTMTHDDMGSGQPIPEGIQVGWSRILSSLKSLLETGQPLRYEG